MNRTLTIIIVGLVIIALVVTIIGLLVPPFGATLHGIFIKGIGENGAAWITGMVTGVLAWGSANGLQAAAVIIPMLILGGIFWVGIKTYLWDKRPSWFLGGKKVTAPTTLLLQGGLISSGTQAIGPVPTATAVTPTTEEKKE